MFCVVRVSATLFIFEKLPFESIRPDSALSQPTYGFVAILLAVRSSVRPTTSQCVACGNSLIPSQINPFETSKPLVPPAKHDHSISISMNFCLNLQKSLDENIFISLLFLRFQFGRVGFGHSLIMLQAGSFSSCAWVMDLFSTFLTFNGAYGPTEYASAERLKFICCFCEFFFYFNAAARAFIRFRHRHGRNEPSRPSACVCIYRISFYFCEISQALRLTTTWMTMAFVLREKWKWIKIALDACLLLLSFPIRLRFVGTAKSIQRNYSPNSMHTPFECM